MTSYKICPKR